VAVDAFDGYLLAGLVFRVWWRLEAEAEAAWTLERERDCGLWMVGGWDEKNWRLWRLGVVPIELSSFQYIYYFYTST
jgi:hypothetical protein